MGMYINPKTMTKQDWLKSIGGKVVFKPTWPAALGKIYLSWVDNGPFDALGVCYDKHEFEACQYIETNRSDGRPHMFFEINKEALLDPLAGLCQSDVEWLKKSKEV